MKKVLLILLTLLVFVLQIDAQRTYALLAGVSNYNNSQINNLANTTNDVKEMQNVLNITKLDSKKYQISSKN